MEINQTFIQWKIQNTPCVFFLLVQPSAQFIQIEYPPDRKDTASIPARHTDQKHFCIPTQTEMKG